MFYNYFTWPNPNSLGPSIIHNLENGSYSETFVLSLYIHMRYIIIHRHIYTKMLGILLLFQCQDGRIELGQHFVLHKLEFCIIPMHIFIKIIIFQ